MRDQARVAFERQKDEEHRLEAEMEARQALEAPDTSKPVLQLEILSNRTNSAEKESPEMALETTPMPMAVQIMVN